MPWFFKVKSGWAPYDEAQTLDLERAYAHWLGGRKEHATLGLTWRVDFDRMLQYRTDDPTRQRIVKRELTPPATPLAIMMSATTAAAAPAHEAVLASSSAAASSSSSGFTSNTGSPMDGDPPFGGSAPVPEFKRRKLVADLLMATDEELIGGLSMDDLQKLSHRLSRLAGFIQAVEGNASVSMGGHPTSEPCVSVTGSEFNKTCDKTTPSHTNIYTSRLFAKIGSVPVVLFVQSRDVFNGDPELTSWKLSIWLGNEGEGDVLVPARGFVLKDIGQEYLWMPFSEMDLLKKRFGQEGDPRTANKWLKDVFSSLVKVMHERHGSDKELGETPFETLSEWLEEYFDEKYIPSKRMTQMEMMKEKGLIA